MVQKQVITIKRSLLIFLFAVSTQVLSAQKIKNGVYIFNIRDIEYHGMIVGKCKAIVKGDHIKLIYLSGNLSLIKPGDIYAEGLLLRHKRTNQWIITSKRGDVNATEVGPCSETGPRTIDFRTKIIEQC